MNNKIIKDRGLVAIEILVVVVVLTLASTVAVPMFLDNYQVNRTNLTRDRIIRIKEAIIGVPDEMNEHCRNSFGFVGDLGVLPANLSQLRNGSGLPAYQLQNNVWFGYRGPYLEENSDLIDAWGNPIYYNDSTISGVVKELRSAGDPSIANDDIVEYIYNNEVNNFVEGKLMNKVSKSLKIDYTGPLDIYYPNGTSTISKTTVQITDGIYNSANENVLFPIGIRYFTTQDLTYKKLAVLNGGGKSTVNFSGEDTASGGELFERTFTETDNVGDNGITYALGTWSINSGALYATGTGTHRALFGSVNWRDYRIEVDATLYEGDGYGIYYRIDGNVNPTGYLFQYNTGLYPSGVELVIRKIVNGDEDYFPPSDRFLIRKRYTTAEFQALFGTDIYNDQHHISITIVNYRHIVKVDGIEIMDIEDSEPLFPCGGLCGSAGFESWEGQSRTAFHSLKVYDIPPLSTGELVWWSFEEGGGNKVYGSGFEIDKNEINGTLYNASHVERQWQNTNKHGNAIYFDGTIQGNIVFGDVSDLNFSPTDTFSVSFWVRILNNSNRQMILTKTENTVNRGWQVLLRQNPKSPNNYGIRFGLVSDKNNAKLHVMNTTEISTGYWYHVVVAYDGSNYSGNEIIPVSAVNIYVTREDSGNVVVSPLTSKNTTLRANSVTANNADFKMGLRKTNDAPLYGYLDEVKIYLKKLSLTEAERLFQKDK